MHISTNDLHCCKPARLLQLVLSGKRKPARLLQLVLSARPPPHPHASPNLTNNDGLED
jgi:hypothetical protein